MKKAIAFAMTAVMAVSMLTACSSSSGSTAPAAPATPETEAAQVEEGAAETEAAEEAGEAGAYTLVKEGTLMVGVEIGYPPMEYFDEDGVTPIGFDIELATAVAEKMGLELELVDTAWDGIFAGVDTEKYDVIFSSVSWTEGRNENYRLTRTYVANAPVLVVPNDGPVQTLEDITADTQVSVQMETTADYLMQSLINDGTIPMPIDNLRQYEKVINAFDELKAGRVDAVCTDSVVAAYYLGDDAANYSTVWQSPEAEPVCAALKKGNEGLAVAIEAVFEELYADGTLTALSEKYFGEDLCAAYFE